MSEEDAQVSGDSEIVQERLLEAIAAKRMIELHYEREDSATGSRTAAPHALFRSGDQRLFLYGFQTDGASNRGGLPDWRRFALESIASVQVLAREFEPQDDYDPAWKAFSAGLIASVD